MTTQAITAEHWNGRGGSAWVAQQEILDRVVRPLGELALDAARLAPGERVLDVGCGCGDTTLAVGERVGPSGRVVGVDVSGPMLERARERLAEAKGDRAETTFVLADATTFEPEGSFDVAVSRFGVMFFDDPTRAFANIARALRPGGRLAFVCWRPLAENPWAAMPLAAVGTVTALPPKAPEGTPGPFAFADAARVTRILEAAGFEGVRVTPEDRDVPLGPHGPGTTRAAVVDYLQQIGPAARVIAELDDAGKAAARGAIEARVAELPARAADDASVWLGAAVWIVTATSAARPVSA